MKALVYHGPGQKAWEEVPDPTIAADTDAIVRVDAVTICGTDLHILKGDVPAVTDGRILGHEAVGTVAAGRGRRQERQAGRPRARLLHHLLRRLPVLPRGPLRPVPRRWRLDPRPQDRRHPGRVRPGAVRRQLHLPGPRRRQRRRGAHARRHPARPATRSASSTARSRPATSSPSSAPARSGCRRSWAPGSSAPRTSSPSTSRTPGSRRPSSSVRTSRSTPSREDAARGRPGAHRWPGRRRRNRGRRHPRDLRAVHRAGPAGRTRRQHRCPRRAGRPPPRGAVDQERHHHHRTRRHLLDADPAATRRPADRSTRPGSSPTASPWTTSSRPTTCSPTPARRSALKVVLTA